MEMFITTYFIIMCLLLLSTVYRLCTEKYPISTADTTKSDDMVRVIISIGMSVWAGILLFGDKI